MDLSKQVMPELVRCSPHPGDPVVLGLGEKGRPSQSQSPVATRAQRLSRCSYQRAGSCSISTDCAEGEHALIRGQHRRLSTHLSEDMRRGARLSIALARFGRHWMSPSGGNHELSENIESYDAFISHDWQTGACLKVATLLLIFNSRAASFVGIGVVIISSAVENWLREDDCSAVSVIGGKEVCFAHCAWSYPVSVAAMLATLCFWQRFRSAVMRRPIMVFFDKLCIEQVDESKKQQGILHLAGYLRHSKKLLVLWSPRYFSRLWCTFELAAWRFLQKETETLCVVPVNLVVLVFVHTMGWCLVVLPAMLTKGPGSAMAVAFWFLLLWFIMLPCLFLAELIDYDEKALPSLLRNFTIQRSKCFCCTNNHIDPETREPIPCDRVLVYKAIQSWFQDDSKDDTNCADAEIGRSSVLDEVVQESAPYLDSYDEHVKRDLAANFTKAMRGSTSLYIVCVRNAGMVYLCYVCTIWLGCFQKLDFPSGLRLALEPLQVIFLIIPTGFAFLLQIAGVGHCVSIPWLLRLTFRSLLIACVHALMWVPVYWARQNEPWIPQIIVMLCLVTLTTLTFAFFKGGG